MSDAPAAGQPVDPRETARRILKQRRAPDAAERARPLGWWYHTKKSFELFPGITRARSARFLEAHYSIRAKRQGILRVALNAIVYAGFMLWIGFRAAKIAKSYKLGKIWQKSATAIARERFADPQDIAFFRIEQPGDLDVYMRRFEYAALNRVFNPANWTNDCLLANKVDFYLHALCEGLPAPRLHGFWEHGETVLIDPAHCGEKVVIKPNDGEGGRDVEILTLPETARTDPRELALWISAHCSGRKGAWIVQEAMEVADPLKPISLNALPTMRVSTFLNEAGEPEIVTSALRFASNPASQVDNIKSGGLVAPIDPETGELGQGCKGKGSGDYHRHPANDAPITGQMIEGWDAVRDLVVKAHKSGFAHYSLIGWDIAPTTRGPIIIEGNGKPSAIIAQRAMGRGIGETRFGEIMAWHLAERDAGRDPLAP